MYYFILLLLFLSLFFSDSKNRYYRLLLFLLTVLLMFRYGQGTDYINYKYHYSNIAKMSVFQGVSYYGLDIGYIYINKLFSSGLRVSFECFIAIISFFMMLALNRFIKKYSSRPVVSLLFFYPTYFLTYYMSTIAQGIVLALFIGVMIDVLIRKRYLIYILLCVICSMIHFSGIILFVGLLVAITNIKNIRFLLFGALFFNFLTIGLSKSIPLVSVYYETPSFLSILEKTLWVSIILYLSRKQLLNKTNSALLSLYCIGFVISMSFIWFPTVSSRIGVYFRILEIVLLPTLLKNDGRNNNGVYFKISNHKCRLAFVLLLLASIIMFCKNINQYLVNGKYYNKSFFSYRYISVFEKDALMDLRDSSFKEILFDDSNK